MLSRAKIVKATSNSTSDKAGLGWKIWVKKFLTFRPPHLCHLGFTAQSGGENISVNLQLEKTKISAYKLCIQRAQMIDVTDIIVYHNAHSLRWPGGRVVMQRFAKPCTSVQFRSGPPSHAIFQLSKTPCHPPTDMGRQ